jgi:hypothetical protein
MDPLLLAALLVMGLVTALSAVWVVPAILLAALAAAADEAR